jgi:hypothetical protein
MTPREPPNPPNPRRGDPSEPEPGPVFSVGDLEPALGDYLAGGALVDLLAVLAAAAVLVPQIRAQPSEEGVVYLPVLECEDGSQVVPVFSSAWRLAQAAPELTGASRVLGADLGAAWPRGVWLIIDPSTEHQVRLPADVIVLCATASRSGPHTAAGSTIPVPRRG